MRKNLIIVAGFLLFNLSISTLAQTGNPPPARLVAIPERGIKNLPYSADGVSETIQTLCDGNRITRSSKQQTFRDGQGRTRTETENEDENNIRKSISIFDPVAGFIYSVNPVEKTVYRQSINFGSRNSITVAIPQTGYSRTSEILGSKVIEGIDTTGSRITTSIAPGTVGNEKELQMVSETWSSQELRATVYRRFMDPRSGEHITKLINIKREEPDPSLFVIPADYKVIEQKPGFIAISNSFTVPKP